jgi:hypothetical protein
MAHGSRVPDDVRLKFAEEFLRTGNASASARKVGIPKTTGTDLAKELEGNEEFVQARASLLTHVLARAESMASELLELTASRAKRKPRELPMGEGGITIHDKSPDYVRAFSDLYRAVQQHAKHKLDSNQNKSKIGPVTISFQIDGDEPEPSADGSA